MAEEQQSRIYTKELVKTYRGRSVVNHVSVNVGQGEIVGLLGPNGAGKTTSFYMVVGFIKPDEGTVFLNNQDITRLPMYKRARMGIGYLPQEASVFRKLSVEDNITAVLEMTGMPKAQQKAKLEELLAEFRLTHVRKSPGGVLSGGERRRTEIARALATSPKFILLDEPFAGIDPIAVEDIQSIVARLKNRNIGILITDHNVNETLSICDRAYLLIEGKIYKHGTAEELAGDEAVRRLYLGRNFELKRKDFIIDEAVQHEKNRVQALETPVTTTFERPAVNQSKLAYSVENLQHATGQTLQDMEKGRFRNMGENVVQDYTRFYNEVKTQLEIKAATPGNNDLAETTAKLPSLNDKEFVVITKIRQYGQALAVGGILAWLFRLIYHQKIAGLRDKLHQVYSQLGTALLFLRAEEN
jgi:lipopolysaccharide export system ATP-binding protein